MAAYHEVFKIQSDTRPTFHDVTDEVLRIIERAGIKDGILLVYSQHTTCSVFIQEESHDKNFHGTDFLNQDLLNALAEVFPSCMTEGRYMHPGPKHIEVARSIGEEAYWSLNTDGHLRSVLMGRSAAIPIVNGKAELGQFGRIFFADFDQIRARERNVRVQIVG